MTTTTETLRWFKSSYSGNGGDCIEVAVNLTASHGTVPVQDSKNPGPTLAFTTDAWSAFVRKTKRANV